VFLDLDETVMVEHESVDRAFLTICRALAGSLAKGTALMRSLRTHARTLWHAGPAYEYCGRVGISSWEGLTGLFPGDHPELSALRAWLPDYRQDAWRLALTESGTQGAPGPEELTARLGFQRSRHHLCYPESREVLAGLTPTYRLALITNGSTEMQNQKIDRAGVRGYFEHITISGELHTGKPDPRVFRHALEGMRISADHALMVGDSLRSDIGGAHAAGMRAVWVDRSGDADPGDEAPEARIKTLTELPALLVNKRA